MFRQLEAGDWRNWIEKAEALDYLSRYDVPDAAPAVQKVLDDKHPNHCWLRGRAVIAMARIDPSNAITLVRASAGDPQVEVRAAAAEVCAELPAGLAGPVVQSLLADKNPLVRFHALAAMARHRGEAAWELAGPAMADVPANCVEPAARTLGWIGTEAARARLLELAVQEGAPPAILRGLEGITAPALASFYLELITLSGDQLSLADVWQAMRGIERGAVIAACRQALGSGEDKQVQTVARLLASHLRDPALGEALQAAMGNSQDRATRLLCLSALSCTGADRFRDVFIAALSHEDARLRAFAVRCLAQCVEADLYQLLEAALSDPDPAVTLAALGALRAVPRERRPEGKLIACLTPSLLSADAAIRREAVAVLAPAINPDNGVEGLEVMRQMQQRFGTGETKPLMDAVFRMVPDLDTAEILQGQGFVARWHVIGSFPAGFGAPAEDVDAFATAYPPEKNIDFNERIKVAYNSKSDKRFGKQVAELEIGWVAATVENADGTLFMTRAGRSELQLPLKHGASYACTEITVPEGREARMEFLFNVKARKKVWLNGTELKLESRIDKAQGIDMAAATPSLLAGKNRILVKVVSDDGSPAWWAPRVSTRGFSLSLTDIEGKPMKWSHE
ncbi:MAG: HEAT repeat domain-containing protein [Luteolibacter sp.]